MDLSTSPTEIHPLITREANLTPPRPLAPLEEHHNDGQEVDLDRLVREGGPQTRKLLSNVRKHPVYAADGRISVTRSFNALPKELRRSSEVVGFVQYLPRTLGTNDTVRWHCVDIDGFPLVWETSDLLLTEAQIMHLEEESAHG